MTINSEKYDDPAVEAAWLVEQRANVVAYLEKQSIPDHGVSTDPKWFVAPYVSLWPVESSKMPGAIGWWVISGDLPTDYLSALDANDPRSALMAFCRRWRDVSVYMLRDEEHPTIKIGYPQNRRELGDLLRRRADILQKWAEDDEIW